MIEGCPLYSALCEIIESGNRQYDYKYMPKELFDEVLVLVGKNFGRDGKLPDEEKPEGADKIEALLEEQASDEAKAALRKFPQ